ncbi:hypothetical protein ACFE04_010297 [Oxalis oulophora]
MLDRWFEWENNEAGHQAPTRNVAPEGRISSSTSPPSPFNEWSNNHALASGLSPPPLLPHRRAPRSNFTDQQEAKFVNFSGEIGWMMIYMRYAKVQAELETFCE